MHSLHAQVLEDYATYGDSVLGKWFVRPKGQKNPNVRTVFKPLLNMFHGERGSKRWKQVVDAKFKTAVSISGLIKVHNHPVSANYMTYLGDVLFHRGGGRGVNYCTSQRGILLVGLHSH